MTRGILVALLHCCIVLSLAGKYALDRARLPRVWVQTAPIDPNMPIRGRYVSLRLMVYGDSPVRENMYSAVRLAVSDGHLVATETMANTGVHLILGAGTFGIGIKGWTIAEPVPFFIPEHIADPSSLAPGEELWVEVSVPNSGLPRPLRLGKKKDGVLTPLELRP